MDSCIFISTGSVGADPPAKASGKGRGDGLGELIGVGVNEDTLAREAVQEVFDAAGHLGVGVGLGLVGHDSGGSDVDGALGGGEGGG